VKQQCILRQFIAINDDLKIIIGVFISNGEKGEESKIAERQRESVCERLTIAERGTELQQ
jgi:hypothetical protein